MESLDIPKRKVDTMEFPEDGRIPLEWKMINISRKPNPNAFIAIGEKYLRLCGFASNLMLKFEGMKNGNN